MSIPAVVFGILLLSYAQMVIGQSSSDQITASNPAEVAARIQRQLELQYPLATTTPDGGDIVAAGAVLVLQRDNLVMNKVYMSGNQRSSPVDNVYENSRISQVGLMSVLSNINSFLSALGGIEAQSRSFGRGEKLSVTKITVETDGIVFRLMSDALNNNRYHATLKLPYASAPATDQAAAVVAEVLATDSPAGTDTVANAQQTSSSGGSASAVTATPEELRRAAEGGDADAMFRLGNAVAQRGDNVEAARWFRRASDSGHIKATNALGFMYEEGRGVPQNYEQASKLYLKAMKGGNADAMINRGIMFAKGDGVKSDLTQAYMHFLLAVAYAADQETREAAVKVKDEVAAKLSKQQVARGQTMADTFAKKEIK